MAHGYTADYLNPPTCEQPSWWCTVYSPILIGSIIRVNYWQRVELPYSHTTGVAQERVTACEDMRTPPHNSSRTWMRRANTFSRKLERRCRSIYWPIVSVHALLS